MTLNSGYLAEIQNAIEQKYGCRAVYRETVFAQEKTGHNETIWFGDVEVFDLCGGGESDRCYAWESFEDGAHIVTVLHNRVVDSARRAVQAAIFLGIERPRVTFTDDLTSLKQRIEKSKKALHEIQIKAGDLEAVVQAAQRSQDAVFPRQG